MQSTASRQVVLTGVSRGLGRAMAAALIEQGHVVHGCARAAETVGQLQQQWPAPHSFAVVDVSDDAQVARWAKQLLDAGVVPDLLINNAALINHNANLWEVPAEEFSHVMRVNVEGVANVIRHFVPAMIERQRGVIVNFSSGWGRVVDAEVAPYCASKWAIEGLSKALAQELPAGMASIPLSPGMVDTDMLRSCFGAGANSHADPDTWARRAVPYILSLGPSDNGESLTTPK